MWEVVSPSSERARRALWSYIEDIASRYYGRPATAAEVEAALRDDPSEDLTQPTGLFLVAQQNHKIVACAGLRLLPGLSVRSRGSTSYVQRGGEVSAPVSWASLNASPTSTAVHDCAWTPAATSWRPAGSTSASATERSPPFNEGKYAEHWFEKTLTRPVADLHRT